MSTAIPTIEPTRRQLALNAALWGMLSCVPWAAVTALVYRFPVPLAGYLSGLEAVIPAMIGTLVYGLLLGGFPLIGLLAALASSIVPAIVDRPQDRLLAARGCGLALGLGGVLFLAVLDHLIGRW